MTLKNQSLEDIKDDFRSQVLVNAKAFREVIKESGIKTSNDTIDALSLQAAIAKRQSDAICQANLMSELRGYHFEARQRSIDRAVTEKQHAETLSSFREDKDWLLKLVAARDECVASLKVALIRSYSLTLAFHPLFAALKVLWVYKRFSYSGLALHFLESLSFGSMLCCLLSDIH